MKKVKDAEIVEENEGVIKSGISKKASEWRSLPNSKTKQYAPEEKCQKTLAFGCNLPCL